MKYHRLFFPGAFFVLALACSVSAQTNGSSATTTGPATSVSTDDRYLIGYKDVIDVKILGRDELSGPVTVNPNGKIYLFRLDEPILAVCKTERQLADEIRDAYKATILQDPRVNVVVTEQRSQSMSVIGAVVKPALYYVGRKVHLLELLALSGGPNEEAGSRLIVARTGGTSHCGADANSSGVNNDDIALMSFKLRDVQEGKKSLWMKPGDVVSVLEADYVYVYGNVEKPGQIKVREPITLTQAIASSQGLKSATDKDAVRVLRQVGNSDERTELTFDLAAIEKGKAKDPYLEPSDIVAVSRDKAKSILLALGDAIRGGIPSAIARGVPVP